MTQPPRHAGIVPPVHEGKLVAARQAMEDAQEAYRQAVASALKAGVSVPEVTRLTGLSNEIVNQWGRERGWPSADPA